MKQSGFLSDLLTSVTQRAGQVTGQVTGTRSAKSVEDLCRLLLSDIGDVSSNKVSQAILQKYRQMGPEDRLAFFRCLADAFDIDAMAVAALASDYGTSGAAADLQALISKAEPARQEILRRLNRVPGGTAELVKMRCDLFVAMREDPHLQRIDMDFAHLFKSWFNPGFLVLRRINWDSPARILEKIIDYEAVHAIDSWDALRLRLLPPDRKCFAYFHPCMPDEPLIFVEVALTSDVPGSIQDVLTEDRDPTPTDRMTTAVFYSISNCQAGLRGVSFGNSLIKQVVEDLSTTHKQLKTFVTLSPMPGFRSWLDARMDQMPPDQLDPLRAALDALDDDPLPPQARDLLRKYMARYLVEEKRGNGAPANAVARFHLGNGAIVHEVHANGDRSANGMTQAYGAMVNYLYDIKQIDTNIEGYSTAGTIARSRAIAALLSQPLFKTKRD